MNLDPSLTYVKAKQVSYLEIFQPFNLKFSLVRKEGKKLIEQHYPVLCRDFLADALLWHKYKEYENEIYKFKITKNFKLDNYLCLQTHQKHIEILKVNLFYLNEIEKTNDIQETKIIYEEPERLVVEFDPFWTSSPPLISLYSFLFKIFGWRKVEFWEKPPVLEAEYILAVPLLDKLLRNLKKLAWPDFKKDPDKDEYYLKELHETQGFVSNLSKKSKLHKQLESL